ncbi:integral membrane sensor signal transduction histidine kinase [Leptolyngbya sp. Heron Island J]|uniref:two-component system sensor histidine kinase RppB n=1 Tax=Leptolyngbya sp. Heron Island J TaxID=1385935 RepID=UPI0003B98C34|nr:two-component system sensor histidine kinase RppB [Leptolyngbya sp. Heron Island J]ESA38947.1 integral membrane sensor signal transduction histidine kinase [Leptolyngbya sp. Heron Island J]
MNSQQLFRRSRLQLAAWYALVMGGILSLSGLGMTHVLVQANWVALEREIESIAGTLHDSLEPMLPTSDDPTEVLQQIFPDLCIANQPCETNPSLIQRHTIGISDRTTYYIRLFDSQGNLLAFSPNQPESFPATLNPTAWQTLQPLAGSRYRQFTTILHSAAHPHTAGEPSHEHPSWGYLQVGRTLAAFDAELQRLRWILGGGFPLALGLIAVASWWLSGLAMQPIYQSYQRQQQFTANAAHELRSPLASLLATVEATLRLPSQQDVPAMLHTVERQGRRLSQLVADLLLLTSLEQDTSPKPPQPCCLNDLIADLTEEFSELATVSDIHLSNHRPDAEIYVSGYESQLYRLVSNLIANAIQYTPTGGAVVVNLQAQDRKALITIKDTGIGIPAAAHRQIFERFYRVDCDRSRKTGSTGLGLAIAKAIAQRHQGHLTLQSEMGRGSLFTVSLPRIHS